MLISMLLLLLLKELFSTDEYDICCHCIDEKKCSRCACLFMVGSQYCKKHDSCDFKTDEHGSQCQTNITMKIKNRYMLDSHIMIYVNVIKSIVVVYMFKQQC